MQLEPGNLNCVSLTTSLGLTSQYHGLTTPSSTLSLPHNGAQISTYKSLEDTQNCAHVIGEHVTKNKKAPT